MKKRCFWEVSRYTANAPLSEKEHASYLIVGGGIAGLFVAHFLLKAGERDIVLVEKNTIGSGSTGQSAGMLVSEIETAPWSALIRKHGATNTALYIQAQKDAQREVAALITKEGIACDFTRRDLILVNDSAWATARTLAEFTMRKKIDPRLPVLLEQRSLQDEIRSDAFTSGAYIERALSVHPLKLAHGIKEYLVKKGVRIFEHTPVLATKGSVAYTPHGEITFKHQIHTTGTWAQHRYLKNYMTTICVTRPLTLKEQGALRLLDKDMFLDEQKRSYHYGKVTADNRLLIGYGDVGSATREATAPLHTPHVENIKRFIRRFAGHPILIEYGWTGQYSLSEKLLPQISIQEHMSSIAGAGTQIASIACASWLVSALHDKTHVLDPLFKYGH